MTRETSELPCLLLLASIALGGAACGFSTPNNTSDGGVDAAAPATVGFQYPTTLVDEASGTVEVVVALSVPASAPITVPYTITGGTATAGPDYTGSDGQLTFNPGDEQQAITLMILPDGDEEENETIELELGAPTGEARLGAKNHTVTISADILPRVNFTVATSTEAENKSPTLSLMLDRMPAAVVNVEYTVTGTAAATADHALASGTITIPANVTTQTIDLPVIDDALDEDSETVIVTLHTPTNVVLGTVVERTHTITDNDPTPTVSFSAATQSKAENGATATVTVQLSAVSGRTVTVPYTVGGTSTATTADYALPTTPSVTIPAGMTSASFTVTITEDALDEDDEVLALALGTPTNATVGTIDTHALTITDNDAMPTVQWDSTQTNGTSSEGDSTLTFEYDVVLSAASGRTVSVDVGFSGSTATANSDYMVAGIPVAFLPGVTRQTVTLTIVNDTMKEMGADEVVRMSLSSPTNATLGTTTAREHAIQDND